MPHFTSQWEYENNIYRVGQTLDSFPDEKNNCFPLVFYKNKLYEGSIIFHKNKYKIKLIDIYNKYRKPFWTLPHKVFNVIRIK